MLEQIINTVNYRVDPLRKWFNQSTKGYDFFAVCVVYALVVLIVGWVRHQKSGWVAKNRELLSFRDRMGSRIISLLSKIPIVKVFWLKKLRSEQAKSGAVFDDEFAKSLDKRRVEGLPVDGMTTQNLRKRIEQWTKREKELTSTQKISGSIYFGDDETYLEDIRAFSKDYLYHNPLHLDTFKEAIKMESQILQMTSTLLTSPQQRIYGVITSGGSESLIMSVYAHKVYYSNRTKPNIVVPETIHAAIDKGCFYFNVECRKARIKDNFEVDVDHMRQLIDGNTIMLAGSAGNYPHGIIDDISAIAKLGKKKDIGVLVDGCLGGFTIGFGDSLDIGLPQFNFKVDGVTAMTIDHHKFGLAPKGVSAVYYKTKKLRQSQYYCKMDWCGGIYGTPTMSGSRSAVASAGAWFALNRITWDGYKDNARQIMQTTRQVVEQMNQIDGVRVFGKPKLCVISFTTVKVSIFKVLKFMQKERHWHLSAIHRPEGAHMTITLANYLKMRSDFIRDLKDALVEVQTNGDKYKGSTQALYGGTAAIPSTTIRENLLKIILNSYLK